MGKMGEYHAQLEDEFPDNYDCEVAQEKRELALLKAQERDARVAAFWDETCKATPEQIEAEDRERHRLHEARWDSVRMK